jgi:hypothetical protein
LSTLHICAPVEALGKRVSKLESLGNKVSKLEVMYGSLKEVKEEKLVIEAKAIAKLDALFGRPKEAQEPPKQNAVIVIHSDSDTSLEFYEDTLKKSSASLVNKRPPKTWAKKIPISSFSKKTGSRSKNIPSSLDSIDDSSSSDESYDAKGHVQLKKRRMSKVSAPRPPRITNCVLGLPAGQKSLGTKFVMYF